MMSIWCPSPTTECSPDETQDRNLLRTRARRRDSGLAVVSVSETAVLTEVWISAITCRQIADAFCQCGNKATTARVVWIASVIVESEVFCESCSPIIRIPPFSSFAVSSEQDAIDPACGTPPALLHVGRPGDQPS
jgi:hypothetical protein